MPRTTAPPHTDAEIRNARFEGKARKLSDGGGLFLLVNETGKHWRHRYRFAGKERSLSLGAYPAVGLAQAREKRQEERQLLAQGIDPSVHRKALAAAKVQAGANTFEAVARAWQGVHRHRVVPAHSERNLRRLEIYVFPRLGREPIADITPRQVLDVLREIERQGKVPTAQKIREVCGQVFRYAIITSRAEHDVTADLRGALQTAQVQHHAALTNQTDIALAQARSELQRLQATAEVRHRSRNLQQEIDEFLAEAERRTSGEAYTEENGLHCPPSKHRISLIST